MTLQTTPLAATTQAPQGQHPLEQLSAQEIQQARRILADAGLVADTTRFAYLGLIEPPKTAFHGPCRGRRPPGPGHALGRCTVPLPRCPPVPDHRLGARPARTESRRRWPVAGPSRGIRAHRGHPCRRPTVERSPCQPGLDPGPVSASLPCQQASSSTGTRKANGCYAASASARTTPQTTRGPTPLMAWWPSLMWKTAASTT